MIEDDIKGIFADFTMRIRLENYNPYFAYYYFRTSFFQYLIEIYKKGLGNNTNIFPVVIKELPIPNVSLNEQEIIVSKIKKDMDQQLIIRKQIESVRNKISRNIC